MVGDTLVCNRCGARQQLTLPQPVDSVVGLMKGWGKTHAKCRGNTSALRQANSLADWPLSDDTGVSSKAIYSHMTGRRPQTAPFGNHPHDPADFGRCYRLLQLAPHWELRIAEMSTYSQVWARLAAAWPELKALYEEELPTGSAPKLYARMKELESGKSTNRGQQEMAL
jgi:hypothetical protein